MNPERVEFKNELRLHHGREARGLVEPVNVEGYIEKSFKKEKVRGPGGRPQQAFPILSYVMFLEPWDKGLG